MVYLSIIKAALLNSLMNASISLPPGGYNLLLSWGFPYSHLKPSFHRAHVTIFRKRSAVINKLSAGGEQYKDHKQV